MEIRNSSNALSYGGFKSLVLTNRQCIIERETESERLLICINADDNDYTAHADYRAGKAMDLLTGNEIDFGGGLNIPAMTSMILKPM